MPKCRNAICGLEAAVDGLYCETCEAYRPICPECHCVYGEHSKTCEVADGYEDCGEGPWGTEEEAKEFGEAEVGLPWGAVKGMDGWYVIVKTAEED